MSKYFISYSRKDAEIAQTLRDNLMLLDSANMVFLDTKSIKVGKNWKSTLQSEILDCDYFILLLSKDSLRSKYVNEELKWVRQMELKSGLRKIYVYKIDNCELPTYVSPYQILQKSNNFIIDFYRLMDGINSRNTFYEVKYELSLKNDSEYSGKIWVEGDNRFLKLIKYVEYRFDYNFEKGSTGVEQIEFLEKNEKTLKNKFEKKFTVEQHFTLFTMLYLTNTIEIPFVTKINLSR